MENAPQKLSCFQIPPHVLDDLCSRFIINVPEEERQDFIRIFFQIELAHWFYLDFYCQDCKELKPCGIKDFSSQVFRHCPFLKVHSDRVGKIFEDWREYKMAVPTYGAIMINPSLTKVVLVQGFWAKSSWMFPKGKVNEDEAEADCAVREVYEETGFSIRDLINEKDFIEHRMNEQLIRLYLVPGVPEDTKFEPRTRKEIKRIEWFTIDHLPVHKKDLTPKTTIGLTPNQFFMVLPFVKTLRRFIAKRLGNLHDGNSDGNGYKTSRKKSKDDSCSDSQIQQQQQLKQEMAQYEQDNMAKQRLRQQQLFAEKQKKGLIKLVGHLTPGYSHQQQQQQHQQLISSPRKPGHQSTAESPFKIQLNHEISATHVSGHHSNNTPSTFNPSDHNQQFRILKRDGTVTQQRRNRANHMTDSSEDERGLIRKKLPPQSRLRKDDIHSETWLNFSLDVAAIMSCFN